MINQCAGIQETLDSSFTVQFCYDLIVDDKRDLCLVVDADKQLVILCYND